MNDDFQSRLDALAKLLGPAIVDELKQSKSDSYKYNEESDNYGFSMVKKSSKNVVDDIKNDENWWNPSNTGLMLQSYDIDDPYINFTMPDLFTFSGQEYIKIRENQLKEKSNDMLEQGKVFYEKGQLENARKAFDIALTIYSKNAEAYLARAIVSYEEGTSQSAVEDAKVAVELNPQLNESTQVQIILGPSYAASNNKRSRFNGIINQLKTDVDSDSSSYSESSKSSKSHSKSKKRKRKKDSKNKKHKKDKKRKKHKSQS